MLLPNAIILRTLVGLFCQFLLGFIVVAAALAYTGVQPGWNAFFLLLSIPALLFTLHGGMLFLGILSARFRDLSPMLEAGMRLIFFLTPIIWIPDAADAGRSALIQFNPFYHAIEIVRAPVIHDVIPWSSFWIVVGLGALVNLLGVIAYSVSRRRLIYWL